MEVATLTARLEADVAAFMRNLAAADAALATTRAQVDKTTSFTNVLKKALADVNLSAAQAARINSALKTIESGLGATERQAVKAAEAVNKVEIGASDVAKFVAGAKAEERALKGVEDQALRTAAALEVERVAGAIPMGAASRAAGYPQFGSGSYAQGGTPFAEGAALLAARERADAITRAQTRGAFAMAAAPFGQASFSEAARLAQQQRIEYGLNQVRGPGGIALGRASGTVTSDMANAALANAAYPTRSFGGGSEDNIRGLYNRVGASFLSSESGRGRDGLMGMLFGARGTNEASKVGSAIERETHRIFGGGNDAGFAGRGLLGGLLPGGKQASAAAVTTALGTILAMGPAAGPAAAGLGLGVTAGAGGLLGGAGTLALAFHGITAAAFKTQEAFDKLTPAQQAFVQTLRSLGAGIGGRLTGIAQGTVLPGLTAGLHSAFSPAFAGALTQGVGAFGGAIAGGAQGFGNMVGSTSFAKSFGDVLQADARYLRTMIDGVTHLTSAFVHLQAAAIPLTDWMFRGVDSLTKWTDQAVQAQQASGGLARFFERSRVSLRAFGGLLGSVGRLFGAVFNVVGFQNSIGTINLLGRALNIVTKTLNDNKDVLRHFFAGALAAANTMLSIINRLRGPLQTILGFIDRLIGGAKGWQTAIETLATVAIGRFALMKLGLIQMGEAAVVTQGEVAGIGVAASGAAAKLAGMAKMLGVVAAVEVATSLPQGKGHIWGENIPLFGSGVKFGQWVGQKIRPPASSVPDLPQTGTEWMARYGSPTSSLNAADVWPDILRGILSPERLAELKSRFPDQQQFKAAMAFSRQTFGGATGSVSRATGAAGTSGGGSAGSIFATPPPLAVKAGDMLPQAMQLAIARASATPGFADDKSSASAAIGYLRANMRRYTPEQQTEAWNTIASLESVIKGAHAPKAPAVPIIRGMDLLSGSRAQALMSAESRAGLAPGGFSGTGHFDPTRLNAENALIKQLNAARADLADQLKKGGQSEAQIRAIEAERLTLAKELGVAHRAVTHEIEAQAKAQDKALEAAVKAAVVANIARGHHQIDQILGIGGVPGMQAIRTSLRRTEERLGHARETGEIIPRGVTSQLTKIHQALEKAQKLHIQLSSEEKQAITAKLAEVNDTLKTLKTAHPSTYHLPSLAELMHGLHGSRATRMVLAQRLLEVEALGGKIPSGQSAFGYPVGGHSAMYSVTGAGRHAGIPIHVHGDLVIHSSARNPEQLARDIGAGLAKISRRNPTQTRGPNAGRNRGLS